MNISIIIPVHNVENYVAKTIRSILRQNFTGYELIIVDDGSIDNSVKVIENELANKNITYKIIKQENSGQANARNVGILHASGDYLVFIDSDDIIADSYLLKLYNLITETKTNVGICDFRFIPEQEFYEINTNYTNEIYPNKIILNDFLYRKKEIIVCGLIIKRQFLLDNNLFFNEKMRFSEDLQFIWVLLTKTRRISLINQELYGYYRHDGSIMTNSSLDRIYQGYVNFAIFIKNNQDIMDASIIKFLLPRWVLGALYTAARCSNYQEFYILAKKMKYKKLTYELLGFKDLKVQLAVYLLLLAPKAFYTFARR